MRWGEQEKLSSKIGNLVTHSAPKGAAARGSMPKRGHIKDEVWLDQSVNERSPHPENCPNGPNCWGDYSLFAQLIVWDDETQAAHAEKRELRLGYYNRPCGPDRGWRYGSQMTLSDEPKKLRKLFEAVLAKEDWFGD